ncbi:lipid-A-disaccharide synthase [Xylophilus sp. Kf1]|nr:lipid-A-disaccharide synthase [Xylophilus sp. Kf1]
MEDQAPAPLSVALVAGETSGDLLAGLLLDGLRTRWPAMTCVGIGGPQMEKRGFEAWWPSDKLAVRGYVEVLRHYREIVGIRSRLRDRLLHDKPAIFIGVDAPDFNLDLEADLRAAGVRCVHFVAPSVWAWRPKRVEKIKRSTDHVLCIFPFEPALLARHGIAATYVGHPLANVIPLVPDRAAARASLGLPDGVPVLAVLPGSRSSEIQYLAPRFFDACRLLHAERPDMRFVVPAIAAQRERIVRAAADAGMADTIRIVDGQSHTVLAACDATLIASGTATLEAALFKRPMVIAYNMHWLSWKLMAPKRLQPWVGLPNILCRDFVVPELLQDAATPRALADAVLVWWASPEKTAALTDRFTALHHELQRDTPALCADAVQKVLEA